MTVINVYISLHKKGILEYMHSVSMKTYESNMTVINVIIILHRKEILGHINSVSKKDWSASVINVETRINIDLVFTKV